MTKEEFNIWLKEHNGKCSIDDLLKLGFKNKFYKGNEYWVDSEEKFALIFEDSVVEPYQPPKTEKVLKRMETYLDSQHYESVLDIDLNKKWYDKFYEHKGRKRWQR
jgi:hypothetical protein